jgi:putative ABC transport system permease protein
MAILWQDIVYGFRMLIKNPAVTFIAVLSLALGIAANTTIFSLINATLLGSLPFPDPERIVILWTVPRDRPQARNSVAGQNYVAWKSQSQSFEAVGAMFENVRNLGAENGAPAERVAGQFLTPSFFKVLGVQPLMGRLFSEAEDKFGDAAPVALLSHQFWQRRFGGAPDILGKTLRLDGVETTIIGVMPPGFSFFDDNIDFWGPSAITPTQMQSTAAFLVIGARLKPGMSIRQAQTEMEGIAKQLAVSDPDRNKDRTVRVEALHETYFGGLRQPLLVLQGAVAFVLLIACANVGGLLLARASSRQTEVAVRTAIGAGRWRIVRQLLTESVILSAFGGAIGGLMAWVGVRFLMAALPPGAISRGTVGLDPRVLGFTALVSVGAGLFFGVVPAIQTSKTDLVGSLKESGRSAMAGAFRQRIRKVMVTVQIALALVLLVGAGLMINSFLRLQNNNVGMDPTNVMTFEFRFPQSELMKVVGRHKGVGLWEISAHTYLMYDRVFERIQSIPGVVSAAAASAAPLSGNGMGMNFTIEGKPVPPPGDNGQPNLPNAGYLAITPKYFTTMKIPLLRGRDITVSDTAAATPVVVINQTMARRYWPDEDPLGKRLTFDFVPDDRPREIIGIVGDTRTSQFQEQARPTMYIPHLQQTTHWRGPAWNVRAAMYYVLRTSGDPTSILPAIRTAVGEIDSTKPVAEVRTVEQYIERQVQGIRLYTILMAIFGAVAASLSAVGLYGVMAYSVTQRTHEIGLRMALGARAQDVFRLVLWQAVLMTSIGLVVGVAGALALTRFMQNELWGVKPTDPPTYIMVSLLLLVVAVLATLIPTRRAVRIDPTIALRYE